MRLPFVPTILVAAAVAVMVALGIWQLGRAKQKEGMLADYVNAAALPPVDLDPLIARDDMGGVPVAFRRALVTCRSGGKVELRAGRNEQGVTGYSYLIPCRPGASGFGGRLMINAGWSQGPGATARLPGGTVAGVLGAIPDEGPIVLVSASAAPPLVLSAVPSLADIPNNHLSYALQWFFFAAAAVVIYVLALRRRGRQKLPPEP